jgi:hypothetical protein
VVFTDNFYKFTNQPTVVSFFRKLIQNNPALQQQQLATSNTGVICRRSFTALDALGPLVLQRATTANSAPRQMEWDVSMQAKPVALVSLAVTCTIPCGAKKVA